MGWLSVMVHLRLPPFGCFVLPFDGAGYSFGLVSRAGESSFLLPMKRRSDGSACEALWRHNSSHLSVSSSVVVRSLGILILFRVFALRLGAIHKRASVCLTSFIYMFIG